MATRRSSPGVPGPARKLTHEQILDAALEILAEEGIGGLTQRRLATRLEVSHMALYRYFESKDDLLDAVVAHALPDATDTTHAALPWYEQLRHLLLQVHDAFAAQPGVAQLMALRSGGSPKVDAVRERFMALMLVGGLPPAQAISGLGVISRYLAGSALVEAAPRRSDDEAEIRRLAQLPPSEFPVLTAIADHYLEHDAADVAAFGVDLLIDSLRRMAERASDA